MSSAWWLLSSTPPPDVRRVTYTAPCPHGRQAEWMGERVTAGDGDGARVVCLCRCNRCLLAVAAL